GWGPYEVEWGDLDGDGDLDGIFMNFGGARRRKFDNASLENHWADRGKLEFTASIPAFEGENSQDENDFALLDADDDGDLDVIVGVLTGMPGPEKLFINQGRFCDGFLKQQVGAFSDVVDGSLDVDVADLDGDGRLDVITVQGENRRGPTHENRVYRNTGPKDTHAPTMGRTTKLDGPISAKALIEGIPIRAWIQDASFDDGVSFVAARLAWRIETESVGDGVVVQSATREMISVGGGIHRAVVQPSDQALVGGSLEVSILATDAAGNSTVSRVWVATIVE
ncbi:MAG: VCBS repeat-containing protein, partial [Planctomycetota bacterium]